MPQTTPQKRSRGAWFLVVQAGLLLLLAIGPRSCQMIAWLNFPHTWICALVGSMLLLAGTLLAVVGAFNLGKNFTPLPHPIENATLIVGGAYRLVRHPIYSGITFMAIGWGVWLESWLTIGYALLLFAFFDSKSRYEERLLFEKFPEYIAYQKQVRKLIPYIY